MDKERRSSRVSASQCFRGILLALQLLGLVVSPTASAENDCITVVYQNVREPYRTVLKQIVGGIEATAERTVHHALIEPGEGEAIAVEGLQNPDCGIVIGLGRSGLQAVSGLGAQRTVVVGAVLLQPGEVAVAPTISMVPDVHELFVRLKHFRPKVTSVTAIFDPNNNGMLMQHATQAARSLGLGLFPLEADDIRTALNLYTNVLATLDSERDALWLLQDTSTVDSDNVLPLVLKSAWVRGLTVFSSQPAYVKNGVLFSVFPDNVALGRQLATLAMECADGRCPEAKVQGLKQLRTAVNLRTAQHLGIRIDPQSDPHVDLAFPMSPRRR